MPRRRVIAGVVLAGVGFVAVGAAQGAVAPAPETGHADARVTLPKLVVTDPTGATHTVDLGSVGAGAVTDTDLLASLGLNGITLLGTDLPGWQVDSTGGGVSGDQSVPLSATGVTGALDLFGYDVRTTADSAHSTLSALTGTVTSTPVDLDVDLGQHGITANTSSTSSDGSIDMTVSGLRLGLGDLLPADVLGALPLSTLLDLASAVDVPLPAGGGSVSSQLADLMSRLQEITGTAADLTDAQQALADLLAALPTTAAAQQQLDDAQQQLTDALAALADAQQQLAADTATAQTLTTQVADLTAQVDALTTQLADPLLTPLQILNLTTQRDAVQGSLDDAQQQLSQATAAVTADQTLVTTAQQQVDVAQAAVDAAQQALDALVAALSGNTAVADAQALVTQLTDSLTDLLDQLTDLVSALPDLDALRVDLLGALTDAPLLDVGTLGATVTSTADDTGGVGDVTCTVTGASVLGQSVPVGPCSGLVQRFADVRAAIGGVLQQLPVTTVPVPVVDGLTSTTSGGQAAAGDVATSASAALDALHVAVPSASLAAITDAVTGQLAAALAATQQQLAGLGLTAVTTALSGPLGDLSAVVAALPSGAGVAGLRTVGLDVSLVGLRTTAAYHLPAADTTGSGGGTGSGSGSGSGTGGNGNGQDPTANPDDTADPTTTSDDPTSPPTTQTTEAAPVPSLPYTGDDSAVETAAALLVVTAGAHLVVIGRRPRCLLRAEPDQI